MTTPAIPALRGFKLAGADRIAAAPAAVDHSARRAALRTVSVASIAIILAVLAPGAARIARAAGLAKVAAVTIVALAVLGAAGWRPTLRRQRKAGAVRPRLSAGRTGTAHAPEPADAVLVASLEGRLVEVNLPAAELLGRSRDALLGRPVWDVLPLDERLVALRRGLAGFTTGGGERRLLRPDGSAVAAHVSWSMLHDGRMVYLARRVSGR